MRNVLADRDKFEDLEETYSLVIRFKDFHTWGSGLPALKGRNMYGFGTRYFRTRSSRNRSGSNSRAEGSQMSEKFFRRSFAGMELEEGAASWQKRTVRTPEVFPAVHYVYTIGDPIDNDVGMRQPLHGDAIHTW